jgi:hypothetical protein
MDVGLSALSGTGAALFVLFVCRKYSYAIESIASRDGNRSISRNRVRDRGHVLRDQ